MKKIVSGIMLTLLLMVATSLTAIPSVMAQAEEDGTVYDYKIVSVTQTGKDEVTVKLEVRYCPYCNPNYASNPGCKEFTHGYPPPYYPYQYWCGGLADGRYVAVRIKDSFGSILGTQKLVCNPINWPLNVILARDFVFSGVPLVAGSTIIAEADVYCSWCGHWYPTPVSLKVTPLKVCIDPGHGPKELGYSIEKDLEYAINKGVADKLKSKLEAKGIEVYFTDPKHLPEARATFTNTLKPDIFVSLHCNAFEGFVDGTPKGTVNGTEVWIYDDLDPEQQARNELELAVRTVRGLSEEIGSKLREPCEVIFKKDPTWGVKEKCSPWPEGIPILRGVTVCPAVLLEMEFFDYGEPVTYKGTTYSNMLQLMNTDIWREDAARGIANGIWRYFTERGFTVIVYSPVDIVVTDPDGLTISKQVNEIPGATYTEIDLDGDGDLDDQVRIPDRKIGDYILTVIPEPDALPTDTYTLIVSLFGESIIIADNVQISDIPAQPYTIISTETGIIPPIILDNIPPTTSLNVGEPKFVIDDTVYLTSSTIVELIAEDNPGGSGVASTAYRIYNATYDSGWITYTEPFYLTGLSDGTYHIDHNSTDNAGNIEPINIATVILDNTGPSVTIFNPPIGWALQDGVTFIASAIDPGSGVYSLNISIREANGAEGIPVGFENLPATYNATTGQWTLFFNTLLLPDGYYIVLAKAMDNLGNVGPTLIVPYTIRNWAVIVLLPASETNKAGRTMPVKFALRVAASVDPNQPFVYNEDITIKIYATSDPSNILQTSTFGDTSRDYRINTMNKLYITNFQTLKTPMQYTVSVYRGIFLIDSFYFSTVK